MANMSGLSKIESKRLFCTITEIFDLISDWFTIKMVTHEEPGGRDVYIRQGMGDGCIAPTTTQRAPVSQHLSVHTMVKGPQTQFFGFLMEASLHRHD